MSVPLEPFPPRLSAAVLCDLLNTYLNVQQVQEVYNTYLYSAEAHDGQSRKSGEPYIFHPLAVAYILGQMHSDTQTLCAALLHDVIEDTDTNKEKLGNLFGEKVAELVDGVSKLSSIDFKTREQAQAASFQKMILAMSHDIRVIILKLADRLHNMRTLGAMSATARQRIARETLEIYAPIANRLGMNMVCSELEDLCFAMLYPWRYRVLEHAVQKMYRKRADIIVQMHTTFKELIVQSNVTAQLSKQHKHYYGIYEKMRHKKEHTSTDKRKTFLQVTHVCALRIITESLDDCYRVLGIVHGHYKPMCERFKDYIAIPKVNGYQSLHTVLFSPHGLLIEIQIRTALMHDVAEKGIMLQGFSSSQPATDEWLHSLLEIQKNASDSQEFLEQVKTDLFPDEVYVFTPAGKIIQLPKGATAIDFAYAIHSELGNHCIATKIDNQYAARSTQLVSGQTVEVLTAPWSQPNPSWLNFAVSGRANTHIRHFLKTLEHDDAIKLGQRMLDRDLAIYALSVETLTQEQCTHLLSTFKIERFETLLADIGLGNRMALIVARQFDPKRDMSFDVETDKNNPLIIKGTEGILVTFSRCCCPIPGDDIVGFISAGRGILIHLASCKHIYNYRHNPEKLLAVEWELGIEGEFLVDIHLEVRDQRGILGKIAIALADMDSNIQHVSNENSESGYSTIKFCIAVQNRIHLATIMRHLRRLDGVNRIQRSKN
ncbi:MAG: bifunctional (p)ppGpp synthetase/guanosine-3',5'-bis(diphosphate) 3'-pyrophosphohydrolase [Thiomargarita sp.]|nr:bifunctional (p)ppGpp synthetase/guanosine-3',5'-bis(diphosphate) 3'-pyrophosphohydrolase [Thiomargarita sp.]